MNEQQESKPTREEGEDKSALQLLNEAGRLINKPRNRCPKCKEPTTTQNGIVSCSRRGCSFSESE